MTGDCGGFDLAGIVLRSGGHGDVYDGECCLVGGYEQDADTTRVLIARAITALHRFTPDMAHYRCWLWQGTMRPNGYGAISVYRRGTFFRIAAHRFALILSGVPVPAGMDACHCCDVRACVNPGHLFVGTRSDNMRDMMDKGRRSYPVGEKHRCAKLSSADVLAIRTRASNGESLRAIAKSYAVDNSWVSRVVSRARRKEVA